MKEQTTHLSGDSSTEEYGDELDSQVISKCSDAYIDVKDDIYEYMPCPYCDDTAIKAYGEFISDNGIEAYYGIECFSCGYRIPSVKVPLIGGVV